jgi:hypothetical protein
MAPSSTAPSLAGPLKVVRTRPLRSSRRRRFRTSSAVPSAVRPSRERRTGTSVQSRSLAACQRKTLVSSLRPSFEVMTTFFPDSRFLVAWNRSPSSPTMFQVRSCSKTWMEMFRSAVRLGVEDQHLVA